MDRKFSDENPKHVYTMHDGNAFTIDVVALNNSSNNNNNNNNNNNEKMDDANQMTNETKMLTRNNLMRKESINGDRSSDVLQPLNSDDAFGQQNEQLVDLSYLRNDNQSNASDVSDNNSTDNISFVSDDSDQRLNHLSDDDSSNSDDVVYAYRGANFEPVNVNADDETDYLEMDFEPDPASEIEQENQQNESPNHVGAAVTPHFDQAAIFETPSYLHNNESHFNASVDNFNCSGSEWLATHEIRINGIDIKNAKPTNGIKADRFSNSPNSKNDFRMENNNALNWQSNKQGNNKSIENTENKSKATTSTVSIESGQQNAYYDKTVSLSITKYTGTIPKTSRCNSRAVKTKPTAAIANENDPKQFNYEPQPSCSHQSEPNGMIFNNSWSANNNKRWKINDEAQSTSPLNCDNATASTSSHSNAKHVTSGMCFMSFPTAREDMTNQRNDCRSNEPKSINECLRPTLTLSNNNIFYGPRGEFVNYDENIDSTSVTFRSSYCSLDAITNALVSNHSALTVCMTISNDFFFLHNL